MPTSPQMTGDSAESKLRPDSTENSPPGSPRESDHVKDERPASEQTKSETKSDILGQAKANEAKYKTVSFVQCGFLLVAETISLGILALPSTVATVGWVPGMLLIIAFGFISTYTGYILYQLKMLHQNLHSFADAAALVFGLPGRVAVEILQVLVFVFLMAAHILTFGVMMNVLTNHGTCTIVFTVAGTVISFACTLPRTLKRMSYLSITSCLSILIAVIVTMVGVARAHSSPSTTYSVVPASMTSFPKGAIAVANIVVAYTAQLTFFGFISELKKPTDFPKSLALLQVCCITLYCLIAAVIYYYAGQSVKSPALNSAPDVFRKAAFGIALPTIIVAGVINAHVCAKNLYVHVFRSHPERLSQRSMRSIGTWLAILTVLWFVAWIIAEAIPNFGQLIGIIGALFCTWFTLGLPVMFWFWMRRDDILGQKRPGENKRGPRSKSPLFWLVFVINVGIFAITFGVCIVGTYGSIDDIIHASKGNVFTCRNNAD